MTRLEANRHLVEVLSDLVEQNPDQRFGQLMRNYSFVREERPVNPELTQLEWRNEFYLESEKLLDRVYKCRYGAEKETPPDVS